MKVKLKNGVNLSSMDNHCGLSYGDWLTLEQGKTVELEEVNKFIEDKVEIVGTENKKRPKPKEVK